MVKILHLDRFLINLLFLILLVDMFNGYLMFNGVVPVISMSQAFKSLLLVSMTFRLSLTQPLVVLNVAILFLIMILGSVLHALFNEGQQGMAKDIIKSVKVLTPVVSFLYFKQLFQRYWHPSFYGKLKKWIVFSFTVLLGNIYAGLLGYGARFYDYGKDKGGVGYKGFFYAGNELSGLLITLTLITSYYLFKRDKKKQLFMLFCATLIAGVLISSKTAILGVILVFLSLFAKFNFRITAKKMNVAIALVGVVMPLSVFFVYRSMSSTNLMGRFIYFWDRLDFLSFVLSSRNKFLADGWQVYLHKYSWLDKIFGAGESSFIKMSGHAVELDIFDIFFNHGFLGGFVFVFLLVYVFLQSKKLKGFSNRYPFAQISMSTLFILTLISSLAGHIYTSGLLGVFLGFAFAVMFYKPSPNTDSSFRTDF